MTREEAYKRWEELLAASNPLPAEEKPTTPFTCLRCGAVVRRPLGLKPPRRCPACDSAKWLDPSAKFRRRRIGQ